MSAFVHDTDHIDLLVNAINLYDVRAYVADVTAAGHWRQCSGPTTDLDELGRLLIGENVKSVLHRYADIDGLEMDGYAHLIDGYTYRSVPTPLPSPAAILKAAHSFKYQACEHDGWTDSDAAAIINALEASLIQALPEYRDADTWCYVRPIVAGRIGR